MRVLFVMMFMAVLIPMEVKAQNQEPEAVMNSFFEVLAENQVGEAYDNLLKGSLILEKPQAVANLKAQTRTAMELYGDMVSYELYREEEFGSSVVRLIYITNMEQLPLFWNAYYYKRNDDWMLFNIKFSDEETDLKNLQP